MFTAFLLIFSQEPQSLVALNAEPPAPSVYISSDGRFKAQFKNSLGGYLPGSTSFEFYEMRDGAWYRDPEVGGYITWKLEDGAIVGNLPFLFFPSKEKMEASTKFDECVATLSEPSNYSITCTNVSGARHVYSVHDEHGIETTDYFCPVGICRFKHLSGWRLLSKEHRHWIIDHRSAN